MFFGSPEYLKFLRYEVLSPQRRYMNKYVHSVQFILLSSAYVHKITFHLHFPVLNHYNAMTTVAMLGNLIITFHIQNDMVTCWFGRFYFLVGRRWVGGVVFINLIK